MRKKILSFALALVMCLGLTVPAFATELGWKLSVSGKTDAEVFVGGKTFILRDWNFDDYDPSFGEIVLYNLYKDNVCVLAKGDTAVFAYKPEESTNHGGNGFGGSAGGATLFSLEAWSDPDGDGVYDRRMISENYDHEEGELAPGNGYEVLPVGTDVDFMEMFRDYRTRWDTGGEDLVRLSADRVLELFGPNTLVKIKAGTVSVDPAAGDWYILVEGDTTVPTVGGFTDVKTSDYFADPVLWAVDQGITVGTGDGTTFSPEDTCTNIQIITFLWRAAGRQGSDVTAPVSASLGGVEDYVKAANWAYGEGIIGADFNPDDPCTRADTVNYMWKAKGSPNAAASSFTDVSASADYRTAVDWAVAEKVTEGTDPGVFSPDQTCTRGQIVTFLYRAFA